MTLCTELLLVDPVLQRVFFDARRFAPKKGHDAIVNIAEWSISEMKVLLQKSRDFQKADSLRRRIRRQYRIARSHSDGYFIDLPGGYDDKCEHVVMFAPDADARLQADRAALAHLQHRFKNRRG